MTQTAIWMMIVILGLVWGGFIITLRIAVKKESQKMKK
jgi:LPS O-antigen subunit length determinant protein (WzzB/FepE family)